MLYYYRGTRFPHTNYSLTIRIYKYRNIKINNNNNNNDDKNNNNNYNCNKINNNYYYYYYTNKITNATSLMSFVLESHFKSKYLSIKRMARFIKYRLFKLIVNNNNSNNKC